MFNDLYSLIASIPGLLLGFAFHEFAHAWVAYKLGDDTAAREGRLNINPLSHLDPVGTLLLIFTGFGWAKPVPVNPVRFTRRIDMRTGMMLVSLAGPLTNVLIALLTVISWGLLVRFGIELSPVLEIILQGILSINVGLAVFNLLPIPPLDGSKILFGLLPYRYTRWLELLEQYSYPILFLMLLTGFHRVLLVPLRDVLITFLQLVANLLV
ncbi:site-2 protease family protein [Carboxydocella sp. JDF658]|uniref:site-2 protease family protein n=1 Tax=Carboxydocella sp. JDF658 TaxID=1926600 RepID=UPI0009AC2E56|nr:site-2 protease family protein [Carboxydocella sp. JDF658]GAW31198.1 Peptidase M50 [Carboxydocella sp. JDF658]